MTPSAITFRARADDEMSPLADLWVASWSETMPEIDFFGRRAWFCNHLRTLEAAGAATICGFDEEGRLVGFATIDPGRGYLDQLAVAPQAKGAGAAAILLNEALRLSPDGLVLDVNQDNLRAVRFYEREGFEKVEAGINPQSGLATWRLRSSKRP
jgi:putative acetyltransferase